MKPIVLAAALLVFILSGILLAAEPSLPLPPALSICQAVDLASRYIIEHKVDVSKQYIHSITLMYDNKEKSKGYYWRIQWMWLRPAIGGEYAVRVYLDGKIVPEPLGP